MTKDLSSLESQHQKLLMRAEAVLSETRKLGEEIQRLKNKPEGIDWSKMPVDTLVEVRITPYGDWCKRYFSHVAGLFVCFDNGNTSKTALTITPWNEIRLIENEPKPWFGGECPIPDGVRFMAWLRDGCEIRSHHASEYVWDHVDSFGCADTDIIAYQILGEE